MGVRHVVAPLAALALLAAAPSPAPSAAPAGATVTVVCTRTPFYVFVSGTDRPLRAHTAEATLGQRFGLVSGPRTTLGGFHFYETNVAVVDPGYPPDAHYWLVRDCAIPTK